MSLANRLHHLEITPEERTDCMKKCSNWVELSCHIGNIDDEDTVLKMLKVELETKFRFSIVNRLYGRFSRLRKSRELREIMSRINELE